MPVTVQVRPGEVQVTVEGWQCTSTDPPPGNRPPCTICGTTLDANGRCPRFDRCYATLYIKIDDARWEAREAAGPIQDVEGYIYGHREPQHTFTSYADPGWLFLVTYVESVRHPAWNRPGTVRLYKDVPYTIKAVAHAESQAEAASAMRIDVN
ncbi:unnamed protein product [Vitrella brassicaformis CCMP3155]|uniref:Uncharacterized protein n=2 Tax=Vitrella brassicaformis TaxID=1169539 RepID=A0A0G4EB56_VITBC|nr:unnamed protein product [Vitrella brassicaformis CCMP3155]|mmetsp:Transcript_35487/g.88199  ORF Transcript_35487/g.88199 Transcript_35487/m.88199 type:complete len:153 (+) Transcript_35487:105-563(+)|eukprot:CEL92474.1 unnamed protein product [Vitrella brassicaformis CCMP3155]